MATQFKDAFEEFAEDLQFEDYADYNEEKAFACGDYQLAESIWEYKQNFEMGDW